MRSVAHSEHHVPAQAEASLAPRPPAPPAQALLRAYLDGHTTLRGYAEVLVA